MSTSLAPLASPVFPFSFCCLPLLLTQRLCLASHAARTMVYFCLLLRFFLRMARLLFALPRHCYLLLPMNPNSLS